MLPIQRAMLQLVFLIPILIFKLVQFLLGKVFTENDRREMKKSTRNFKKEFKEKAGYTILDFHVIMRYVLYIGFPVCFFCYGFFTSMDVFSESLTQLTDRILNWGSLLIFLITLLSSLLFLKGNFSIRSSIISYFILLTVFPMVGPLVLGGVLHYFF